MAIDDTHLPTQNRRSCAKRGATNDDDTAKVNYYLIIVLRSVGFHKKNKKLRFDDSVFILWQLIQEKSIKIHKNSIKYN